MNEKMKEKVRINIGQTSPDYLKDSTSFSKYSTEAVMDFVITLCGSTGTSPPPTILS
jgi:hypothetical protein